MQIHGPSHVHGPQAISAPHRTQAASAAPSTGALHGADQLDISHEAQLISQTLDLPEIRSDRVAELRAQIAAGTYETSEKLEIAVGRLLDEISG